ncbi:MAG: NDP-sugar synthase [Candidatus Bathyarchaeota archaeon]|nr:NDP-sugar synthase [Candidatus Bathyarchaeota archaeon]
MGLKAIILAGGFGTRLRPLSCTRPKLLFPIVNKPILDLTLQRLAENGIKEVILAVSFMADAFERTFGTSKYGMKIRYSLDMTSKPRTQTKYPSQEYLGTAGPVRQAEKLLGKTEPFLVLNGDILTNANYAQIMKAHKNFSGLATIALHKVEDPSRYGVVKLTQGNRIAEFVEKPIKWTTSKLVNAGIYVLEPDVFDLIPKGKRRSIEREIFPILATKHKLYGHEITGLWIDIGKPVDYIKANKLWLEAEMERSLKPFKTRIGSTTKIAKTVAVGEDVTIEEGSIIGPNVSLGNRVSVGTKVRIRNSIVFPTAVISDLSVVEGSIIGEAATIGKRVRIKEGCLIGDNTTIEDNITLAKDVKICHSRRIVESISESGCVI